MQELCINVIKIDYIAYYKQKCSTCNQHKCNDRQSSKKEYSVHDPVTTTAALTDTTFLMSCIRRTVLSNHSTLHNSDLIVNLYRFRRGDINMPFRQFIFLNSVFCLMANEDVFFVTKTVSACS